MSSTPSPSFLNIWARGVPADQLTPKASAQAGTSREIDPFDLMTNSNTTNTRSNNNISSISISNNNNNNNNNNRFSTSSSPDRPSAATEARTTKTAKGSSSSTTNSSSPIRSNLISTTTSTSSPSPSPSPLKNSFSLRDSIDRPDPHTIENQLTKNNDRRPSSSSSSPSFSQPPSLTPKDPRSGFLLPSIVSGLIPPGPESKPSSTPTSFTQTPPDHRHSDPTQPQALDNHLHSTSTNSTTIQTDDADLRTPMPASPRGERNPNFFNNPHLHPTSSRSSSTTANTPTPSFSNSNSTLSSISNSLRGSSSTKSSSNSSPTNQGMAASALKAIGESLHKSSFSFTSDPISRTKNLNSTELSNSRSSSKRPSNSSSSINSAKPNHQNSSQHHLQPGSGPGGGEYETGPGKASSSASASSSSKTETSSTAASKASLSGTTKNESDTSKSSSDQPPRSKQMSKNGNGSGPKSGDSLALPPKGLLSVKIVSAKSLRCASSFSRPYVVAQFDNNEFVSREPIGEEEDETKGVANLSKSRDGEKAHPVGAQPQRRPSNSPSMINSDGNGVYCLSGQNPLWKQEVDFDVTQHESDTLRQTLHVSVYDRSVGDLQSPNHVPDGGPPSSISGIEGVEVFLGETEIELHFDDLLKRGGWYDQVYKLTTKDLDTGIATEAGEIRVQLKYRELKSKKSLTVSDFEFLKMIGRGTFGRVFQVRKKDTKRIYAMKVLSKKEVIDKKEVQHTIGERNILQQSNQCPFLLGLKFSFQSPGELFLVMDYKSGGELFHHLQKEGRFTEERARFYTAEIVLALEHLHKYNIVYRDLKPENILLDANGHIVLCDFGLSKPNLSPDELTTTFCGTTEYLAPEVLLDDHGYSKLVDFWSLGVLLFEMCCGWSPFYAEDNQQMYKNICFGKIKFPRGVIGDDGKQFVKGLLNRNPKHRLGAQNDAEDLKKHAFFKSIDWHMLENRQIVPTFKPYIDSDDSVANFDKEFTQLNIEEELPMTMRGLRDFDENDRSDDWLKQASYHQQSQHLYGGAGKTSFGNSIHLSQTGKSKNGRSGSGGGEFNSIQDVLDRSPPEPVPLVKDGKPIEKSEDDNCQDQFLGFSYHGESEFPMGSNKFGMSRID